MSRVPFADPFDSLRISTGFWDGGSYNYSALVANGQLNMTASSGSAAYHGLVSESFDLTGSSSTIEVVDVGNQSLTSFELYPLQIYDHATGNQNNLWWLITGHSLQVHTTVGGTATQRWSATYNSTTHKYLRIREASGTIYWGYSADGSTWTEAFSMAAPFGVTSTQLEITVGCWQSEASSSTAILDNLNILPGDPPPVVGNGAARIPFQDTFDTLQVVGRWDGGSYNTGTFTVAGSQLNMTAPAGSTLYHGLVSEGGNDLTGNECIIQVVDPGNQSLTSFELYPMQLYKTGDITNKYWWYIGQNSLIAFTTVGGTQTSRWSTTFNISTHKYLRIRESGGVIYWGYTADGVTWTEPVSFTNPFVITDMQLEITVGCWQSEASSSTAIVDNLNLLPGETPAIPPSSLPNDPNRVPFKDNFETFDNSHWVGSYNIDTFVFDGKLTMTAPAGTTLYHGLVSVDGFSLTAKQCTIQVIDAGNQSLTSFEMYPIQLYQSGNVNNNFFWYIGQNFLSIYTTISGTKARRWGTSYDADIHKYLRIRESGGTITYGFSTDGNSWTEPFHVNSGVDISNMQLEISVGCWRSEASSSSAIVDNLNILPGDDAAINNSFFRFF